MNSTLNLLLFLSVHTFIWDDEDNVAVNKEGPADDGINPEGPTYILQQEQDSSPCEIGINNCMYSIFNNRTTDHNPNATVKPRFNYNATHPYSTLERNMQR